MGASGASRGGRLSVGLERDLTAEEKVGSRCMDSLCEGITSREGA